MFSLLAGKIAKVTVPTTKCLNSIDCCCHSEKFKYDKEVLKLFLNSSAERRSELQSLKLPPIFRSGSFKIL